MIANPFAGRYDGPEVEEPMTATSKERGMESMTWLRCKVSPGQFTGEYVVAAKDFRGQGFSFFVPDEYVQGQDQMSGDVPVDGLVQVAVLEQSSDLVLVRLPRVALQNGQTVTVRSSDLVRKPARELA
jgi:hypothetical protein